MRGILKEFKDFIAHGNLIDLAVAVVIGTAFAALVKALVEDIVTPIIAAIFGKPDFSDLVFTINGSAFKYGSFLNAVITFVSVAAAVFFLIVKPMNLLTTRISEGKEPDVRGCPECLSEIPAAATRCAHCTTQLAPA